MAAAMGIRTIEEIYGDFAARRGALVAALTDDVESFWAECDPNKENLCLYGNSDGTWKVGLPVEEVPPELPEPALGINFARDGMADKEAKDSGKPIRVVYYKWLELVAVHSDAWLMSVAFFFAAKAEKPDRLKLFNMINQLPTVWEELYDATFGNKGGTKHKKAAPAQAAKRDREPECYDKPSRGRIMSPKDNIAALQGSIVELFWPDDGLWYRAEILALNTRGRSAKVLYSTGDVEQLALDEVIADGHLNIVT